MNWNDSDDLVYNKATLSKWAGTKLIRKEGSVPTNIDDGVLLVNNTVRNQYSETSFIDDDLKNGETYFYQFFTYSTDNTVTAGKIYSAIPNIASPNLTLSKTKSNPKLFIKSFNNNTEVKQFPDVITFSSDSDGEIVYINDDSMTEVVIENNIITIIPKNYGTTSIEIKQLGTKDYRAESKVIEVNITPALRYGFRIKDSESNPDTRVEYLFDAEDFQPAGMNASNNTWNYGSWEDVWFVKDNKPLMLKYDGTVDYYLKPDNYYKKEDGTDSDITNVNYEGNAMVQFPLIYVYRYSDSNYSYFIASNVKWDENYFAYAHERADGTIMDYFYWSMYIVSNDGTRLRSLAGQTPVILNLTNALNLSSKNNADLCTPGTWSRFCLIRDLCVLITKSTNLRVKFNNNKMGVAKPKMQSIGTGTSRSAQFYGENHFSGVTVKIFHIEGLFGIELTYLLAGCMCHGGNYWIKMSQKDGKYSATDLTLYLKQSYIYCNKEGSYGSGYVKSMVYNQYGSFYSTWGGSATQYYCEVMSEGYDSADKYPYCVECGGLHSNSTYGLFSSELCHAHGYYTWSFLNYDMPLIEE